MAMTQIEQQYVRTTYDTIAENFSNTRAYLWDSVKKYVASLPKNSVVLEVGCGNGKNLDLPKRRDLYMMGCDFTPKFCEITQQKGFDTQIANNLALPYRSNSIDHLLSIAVIHHLSTEERRLSAVQEMLRVLRPGGTLLIQVWAKEQPKKSRNTFTTSDNLVSWQNSAKTILEHRFYHVFSENELETLLSTFQDSIKVIKSFYEVGNWVMIIEKNS